MRLLKCVPETLMYHITAILQNYPSVKIAKAYKVSSFATFSNHINHHFSKQSENYASKGQKQFHVIRNRISVG